MREVDVAEVHRIVDRKEPGVIIDVLSRGSFAKKHVPRSVNVPVSDPNFLEEVRKEVKTKDTPVVVYCADPECEASPKAARMLEEAGYRDVREFSGGLEAWQAAGYSFDGPSGAI